MIYLFNTLKPLSKIAKSLYAFALVMLPSMADKNETSLNYKHIGFNYYFDTKGQNLYYKELPIKLGVKEKSILNKLVEANGNIVSFKELEYLLWQDNPISDSSLRTIIYRLRNKLEHKLIETVHSFGIKLTNI